MPVLKAALPQIHSEKGASSGGVRIVPRNTCHIREQFDCILLKWRGWCPTYVSWIGRNIINGRLPTVKEWHKQSRHHTLSITVRHLISFRLHRSLGGDESHVPPGPIFKSLFLVRYDSYLVLHWRARLSVPTQWMISYINLRELLTLGWMSVELNPNASFWLPVQGW